MFWSANVRRSLAPSTLPATDASARGESGDDIVVTGSRIRRSAADSSAPTVSVEQQTLTDRGFTSAAQALNNLSFNAPALAQAANDGSSSGPGIQSPNLFNLGAGRTLSLINGRRMVTSSNGAGVNAANVNGDAQIDANIIPIGLLDRVEVAQAGGAAVYGSDAIAGVVNYVLKKNFSGIELDVQNGISSYGDYATHSARGTVGANFADKRGNIALDVEWSKTPPLFFSDRPLSNLSRVTVPNSADTGGGDGIPSVRELTDTHFWEFNTNGVIFRNAPAPVPIFLSGFQFQPDGNVIRFNPGAIMGVPFAKGGDGFRYADLVGLRTANERLSANLIGHYDLSDRLTLSTELLYARTQGTEYGQAEARTVLGNAPTNSGAIAFTIANPFLTDAAKTALSAAIPSFGAGAPLFLSKYFVDLRQDNAQVSTVKTYRGLLSLDGTFDVGDHNFYYSLSGSYARVDGAIRNWQVVASKFNNAIRAARNSAGQIVCAINADANTTNDDSACSPINPFGAGNVTQAARDYVNTLAGHDYRNQQIDLLASIGGDLMRLPAGQLKFSAAYEHRLEKARFDPLPANRAGNFGAMVPEVPSSGSYHTNELSGELLVPLVGGDFKLPLVNRLELNLAYRYVANSLAGNESVWNVGGTWEVVPGITFRTSRSRNFRAPTLTQLLAPNSVTQTFIQSDACDADRINGGPRPDVRRKNCLALFEANPGYGVGQVLADGTTVQPGASAAVRLANFQDPSESFNNAIVTSGGNRNLRNEISNTLTFGIVIELRMIPGLSITADRIQVDLRDGLSNFTTQNFIETCMDNANPSATVCNAFARLANPDGTNPGGTIIGGTTTTFNAGVIKYRGEVYRLSYQFPLRGGDLGQVYFGVEATHNDLLTTSVTGDTFSRTDNTIQAPTWSGRLDLRYVKGPFRFTYQLAYLGRARPFADATIETTPTPTIDSNVTHAISAQYDFGKLTLRAGIINLTNQAPSYPSLAYGDIVGRQIYVGAKVKF